MTAPIQARPIHVAVTHRDRCVAAGTITVKAHVSSICEKPRVGSRVQVGAKAAQRGLVRV